MVVYAVISHWVTLVTGEEVELERFGQPFQWLAAFFYTDDGLLASPRLARLQATLGVLIGVIEKFGLQTKINKTSGMVCQPYHMTDEHSEAAYARKMTGVGPSFRGPKRQQVCFLECAAELTAGSLAAH